MDGIILHKANSVLYKEESKLTRKLGFNNYKKALNLPAEAYEKLSSGVVINRITNDADTLSFTFGRILDKISKNNEDIKSYSITGEEYSVFKSKIQSNK